jgi:hypothetical protein
MTEDAMETVNRLRWSRSVAAVALVALALVAVGSLARADDTNDGIRMAQSFDGSLKTGWTYLKTALALIVGGGFLAAGGRAMTRGDWTNGGIAVGFGVILLIAFFALGKTLGLA